MLPALMVVLAAALWAIQAVAVQLECVDAARVAARAAARGEPLDEVRNLVRVATGHEAQVNVSRNAEQTRIEISVEVHPSGPGTPRSPSHRIRDRRHRALTFPSTPAPTSAAGSVGTQPRVRATPVHGRGRHFDHEFVRPLPAAGPASVSASAFVALTGAFPATCTGHLAANWIDPLSQRIKPIMRVKMSARRSDRGSATLWAVALMGSSWRWPRPRHGGFRTRCPSPSERCRRPECCGGGQTRHHRPEVSLRPCGGHR